MDIVIIEKFLIFENTKINLYMIIFYNNLLKIIIFTFFESVKYWGVMSFLKSELQLK